VGQGISDYFAENDIEVGDQTDYGTIKQIVHDQVDSVVEGRLDQAVLRKENGDTIGSIRTN